LAPREVPQWGPSLEGVRRSEPASAVLRGRPQAISGTGSLAGDAGAVPWKV